MNYKKLALVLLSCLMIFSLTACGGEDKETLYVYNWGDYIDTDLITEFETETGIDVVYETFATNEEMYAKIKQGGISYDVAMPSDYMISKMITEDMLMPLDMTKIPNYQYIGEAYKNLEFDPNNEYSVPYFWGTVGIIYNTDVITEEINSWDALFDEQYSGRITMIDSSRDSIMVALKKLGYSMNTRSVDELNEARDLLIEQKPLVKAYVGDTVKDMLLSGSADMAVVWSGEAGMVLAQADHFNYVVPKEGSNNWFDNMVIPSTAQNVEGAHKFIDFMTRPENALKNTQYVEYSTCNTETMTMLDEATLSTSYGYPDISSMDNMEVFIDPSAFVKEYDRVWTELKAN